LLGMATPQSIRLKFVDSATNKTKKKRPGKPVGHFSLRPMEGSGEPWRLSVWLPRGLAEREPVEDADFHTVIDGEGYEAGSQALVDQVQALAKRIWAEQCDLRLRIYEMFAGVEGNMVRLQGFHKPKSKAAWWAQLQNEQHRARSHYERASKDRLESAWEAGWPQVEVSPFPWAGCPDRLSWEEGRKALWEVQKRAQEKAAAKARRKARREAKRAEGAAQARSEDEGEPLPEAGDRVLVKDCDQLPDGAYEVGETLPGSQSGE